MSAHTQGPFDVELALQSAVDVRPHRWEYCTTCRCFVVVCANCGNNCCNGGSACQDACSDAYAKQKAACAAIAKAEGK